MPGKISRVFLCRFKPILENKTSFRTAELQHRESGTPAFRRAKRGVPLNSKNMSYQFLFNRIGLRPVPSYISNFYSISNFDAQDEYTATMAALSSSSLPSPNQTDLDPIACSISIPLPPIA